MKTSIKILAIGTIAALLGSCSSSMQLANSSGSKNSDIYYNPSKASTSKVAVQESNISSSSSLKLAELEKKYTEILAKDSTPNIDTVVYRDTIELNPYRRILADSYQDAYERRIKAFRSPSYGIGSWAYRYSDDFWYASAYDPYFYNVIVMGDQIWVEPRYISAMFGWSYYGNRFYGSSFGFAYSGWGSYWYSPWNSYWYSPWNYYGWGNNWAYYDNINGVNNPGDYRYGRRPGMGDVYGGYADGSSTLLERNRRFGDKQVVLRDNTVSEGRVRVPDTNGNPDSQIRGGRIDRVGTTGTETASTKPVRVVGTSESESSRVVTKPSRQDPQSRVEVTRPGRVEVVEPVRDRNNNVVTRPSRDVEVSKPSRETTPQRTVTTPSREHNPTYTKPNPGNSNEFNRPTRTYPTTEGGRGTRTDDASTRPTRQPSREYNPPPRTATPSNSTSRDNNYRDNSSRPSGSSNTNSSSSSRPSSSSSSHSNTSSRTSSSNGNSVRTR